VGVFEAISVLGSRIVSVHTHDNNGMKDEHLWPGDGTIDWPAVCASLAALPAATPGILEVESDRDEAPESVTRKAEKAFRTLADLASAPASQNM
jgi:sugar phosphate isomerase/epimerase